MKFTLFGFTFDETKLLMAVLAGELLSMLALYAATVLNEQANPLAAITAILKFLISITVVFLLVHFGVSRLLKDG